MSRLLRDTLYAERYSRLEAFLQGIDVRIKLIVVSTSIVVSATSRSLASPLLFILFAISLALASSIPLRSFLVRTLVFIPLFALAIVSPIPLISAGSTFTTVGFGPIRFSVTEGLYTAGAFVLRVWACVSLATLLVLTTDFPTIVKGLERLGVPKIFAMMIMVTYRYIFFFLNMIQRMLMAKESRTMKTKTGQILGSLASNLGALLIRAYEEGEKVYLAMCSRVFSGEIKVACEMGCGERDYYFLTSSLALCSTIALIELGFLGIP